MSKTALDSVNRCVWMRGERGLTKKGKGWVGGEGGGGGGGGGLNGN